MDVEKICSVLKEGGLVITPTDTIYGIMGDATNVSAINKLFDVKKRAYSKPLILLMDSYEMIEDYTSDISDIEKEYINKFFPGLVTIILKKNEKINDLITAGMDTVGIRIPDNKDLREIIKRLGRPIFSTSANVSNEAVITNINMISDDLKKQIDYIYDGGEVNDVASTIIKFDNNNLKILRDGKMSKQLLDRFSNK